MRAMGVENFLLALQALARNAAENGAIVRGRRRSRCMRGSQSGRLQPASSALDTVPEQLQDASASQDLSAGLRSVITPASNHHPSEVDGPSTSARISDGGSAERSDLHTSFSGYVHPGEVSDGCETSSISDLAAKPPPAADLSHIVTQFDTSARTNVNHLASDAHAVGEGVECYQFGVTEAVSVHDEISNSQRRGKARACPVYDVFCFSTFFTHLQHIVCSNCSW